MQKISEPEFARPGWHRADIIAALHKRGITLESLGRKHGKGASSMSAALSKPSRGCNLIISRTIGVPLHVMWPAWFDARGRRIPSEAMRRGSTPSSRKRTQKSALTGARA